MCIRDRQLQVANTTAELRVKLTARTEDLEDAVQKNHQHMVAECERLQQKAASESKHIDKKVDRGMTMLHEKLGALTEKQEKDKKEAAAHKFHWCFLLLLVHCLSVRCIGNPPAGSGLIFGSQPVYQLPPALGDSARIQTVFFEGLVILRLTQSIVAEQLGNREVCLV